MRRILIHGAVFAAAFLLTLAFSLPLELLAARLVFARIARATGFGVQVADVRLVPWALPPALDASGVAFVAPDGVRIDVPRVRVSPGLGILWGRRAFRAELYPGDGRITARYDGETMTLTGTGLRLERLSLLGAITDWRFTGPLDIEGEVAGTSLKTAHGALRFESSEASVSGARFLGMNFPEANLGRVTVAWRLANGTLLVKDARASGGNMGVRAEGGITLSDPWNASVLGLTASLSPSPEFLASMGPSGRLLTLASKPDGTVLVGVGGTLSAPQPVMK